MPHRLIHSERLPIVNECLVQALIEKFVPKFVPGGEVVYAKDGNPKINNPLMEALGFAMDSHQSMPDAMVYCRKRNWLFVAESASGNGLIDEERAKNLAHQFSTASVELVLVSVFQRQSNLTKHPGFPAHGTSVWFADEPDHMMHFD